MTYHMMLCAVSDTVVIVSGVYSAVCGASQFSVCRALN